MRAILYTVIFLSIFSCKKEDEVKPKKHYKVNIEAYYGDFDIRKYNNITLIVSGNYVESLPNPYGGTLNNIPTDLKAGDKTNGFTVTMVNERKDFATYFRLEKNEDILMYIIDIL